MVLPDETSQPAASPLQPKVRSVLPSQMVCTPPSSQYGNSCRQAYGTSLIQLPRAVELPPFAPRGEEGPQEEL